MRPVPERIICTMNAATIASETMPMRSARSRFHASAHNPGETLCGDVSKGIALSLLQLHARIDGLVHQVREQVHDHGRNGDINRDRLDHREVTALDRENHLA